MWKIGAIRLLDFYWHKSLVAAAFPRPYSRLGLCHLHQTVQIQLSTLQPFNHNYLRFPSYIQFEGLHARLNHPEGALIWSLKRSLVAIMSDENKLVLVQVP